MSCGFLQLYGQAVRPQRLDLVAGEESISCEGRGCLRNPEPELGLGEELAYLDDGVVVLLLRQLEQPHAAVNLVAVTDAIEHAAVKPGRRPDAVIATAGVAGDAAGFMHAGSEEDHEVVAVKVTIGIEIAGALPVEAGAAGDRRWPTCSRNTRLPKWAARTP